MNPDHDPTRRPRVYYEEDQEEVNEDGIIGTLAVIVGVIITVTVAVLIGGYLLFDRYKHLIGF